MEKNQTGNWIKDYTSSYNTLKPSPAKKRLEMSYASPLKSPYKSPNQARLKQIMQKTYEIASQKSGYEADPHPESENVIDVDLTPQKGELYTVEYLIL
jgi:hypothetical protein